MYILVIKNKEEEGAYAVKSKNGNKVLHIFEEEDDAIRYAGLLEANGFPNLFPIEVDEDIALFACEHYDYNYTIIKKNDFVFPPEFSKRELI